MSRWLYNPHGIPMIARWSMYGIFTYIYPKNDPNVGKYSIHGASGTLMIQQIRTLPSWSTNSRGKNTGLVFLCRFFPMTKLGAPIPSVVVWSDSWGRKIFFRKFPHFSVMFFPSQGLNYTSLLNILRPNFLVVFLKQCDESWFSENLNSPMFSGICGPCLRPSRNRPEFAGGRSLLRGRAVLSAEGGGVVVCAEPRAPAGVPGRGKGGALVSYGFSGI